jgi:hypothetical protein
MIATMAISRGPIWENMDSLSAQRPKSANKDLRAGRAGARRDGRGRP